MQDIIARALGAKANKQLATLGTVFDFKGVVPTVNDLPSNASKGDAYAVIEDGKTYAYNGDSWQFTGSTIDMSLYLMKSELQGSVGNSTDTTMTQAAITQNFNKVYIQETQPAHANEGDIWINPVPDGSALPSFENEEF